MQNVQRQVLMHRLHSLDLEITGIEMKQERQIGRRRHILFGILISAIAIAVVMTGSLLVRQWMFFGNTMEPLTLSLSSAQSNGYGMLKVMLNVDNTNPTIKKTSFEKVTAVLKDTQSQRVFEANVIPVYMKSGQFKIFIQVDGFNHPPGDCDIQLNIKGKIGKANSVSIRRTEPMI
jgi:hypothetical protein